jgi:hypothetical protein
VVLDEVVLLDMCQRFKNTLCIQKDTYNFEVFLQDLSYSCNLKDETAYLFYELFLDKTPFIPYAPLREIEENLEQSGEMHEVDLVTNYMKAERLYYIVCEWVLRKIENNKQLLILFIRGYLTIITSNQYSFQKNKAVLPFHRVFATGLFAVFCGDLGALST